MLLAPARAAASEDAAKAAEVVERPVSGPDFMATVLTLLGLDPASDLHAGKRPVRMVAPGARPSMKWSRGEKIHPVSVPGE